MNIQSLADASPPARPFRCWVTSNFAVITAATLPLRGGQGTQHGRDLQRLCHSRFDVRETVQRIETAAHAQGLSVLAVMPGSGQVVVLASSMGGTVVVMDHADSQPEMPLSMVVREDIDGGADVWVAASAAHRAAWLWDELPSAVADDLRALPQFLERALQ